MFFKENYFSAELKEKWISNEELEEQRKFLLSKQKKLITEQLARIKLILYYPQEEPKIKHEQSIANTYFYNLFGYP